ncbi:MAG TPA: replicative DNA helicase [Clostridiales bacterium]|nr:replicative DNA helicase [Clostridiales bacterium]
MAKVEMARKMPYSIEAEQSVLGCMLISNTVAGDLCSKLSADDFYSDVHKTIFSAMKDLMLKNQPIDYVTLISELEKSKKLEEIGGLSYITTLTNVVPTAANYENYAEIVLENAKLRRIIDMGNSIVARAYDGSPSKEIIDYIEKQLTDITTSTKNGLVHIKEGIETVNTKFETIAKDPNAVTGLQTDYYALDNLFNGGLHKGDLILIAARPGVGKTSLAMNIVSNCALNHKATCAIFSLEMPKEQLAQRILCSVASVDMSKALKGELSPEDWTALWTAKKRFVESQIYVDDSSLTDANIIRNECLKLKREHGLDLVMIDYVQLMNATSGAKGLDNRQQEISSITRYLKIAAKELDVPILLLSQLSRAVEARTDHRPMLSDLRESGAIEQDADIVMFIYNPDMYSSEDAIKPGIVDLIVAKHRNGGLDTIKLKFNRENTTFVNLTQDANAQSLERSIPKEKPKKEYVDASKKMTPIDETDITDDVFK